ncbi:MAG: hypothetical protein POELPBGB_03841 [Bacteroidia bacterium]|nr:hypothetical protein [Bacteroidia bacterium]
MKNISTYLIGVAFILAGINHFINPAFYLRMMPPVLPAHELLNYASGVTEILLGVMLFIPQTKIIAARGLIILLIALYPANIYMAMEAGKSIAVLPIIAYIRLPFQFLFIWLVYRETK